jgi:hypothetical protein
MKYGMIYGALWEGKWKIGERKRRGSMRLVLGTM